MRSPRTRKLILLGLAAVVLIGCFVPAVFQDTYESGAFTHHRNRLTGDVTSEFYDSRWSCLQFGPAVPRSVWD